MKRVKMSFVLEYVETDTTPNSNPEVYGMEEEEEIDKYINEIELGNKRILNQKAISILESFLK